MVCMIGDKTVLSDLLGMSQEAHERKRVYLLVVPSGAKAGYISAIIMRELARRGLTTAQFRIVVATSAGFLNAMALCAGQQELTPEIYLHLAAKPWLFPAGFGSRWVTFYDYLTAMLRGEVFADIKLDVNTLMSCPSQKMAAVSDVYGRLAYHTIHTVEDVFTYMHAASAIMPFSFGQVLGGHYKIDGAYAHAHCQFARQVRALIREVGKETDVCVLFIGNRPGVEYQHWTETYLYGVGIAASLWWSPRLMRSALALDRKVEQSERLFHKTRRARSRLLAILPSPEESIHPVEYRASFMREQGEKIVLSLARAIDAL